MLNFLLLVILPFVSASVPLLNQIKGARCSTSNSSNPVGQPTSKGVLRYSVKYASAKRWDSPVMVTKWTPSNPSDPTALPLPCPQPNLSLSQYSEDCLDLVLYIPPSAKTTPGGIPLISWVHGGSFFVGSASDPGLDASNLAIGANSIVAVVQYRLGVLGLLPPSSTTNNSNLALQDLVTASTFLHTVLPTFGISASTQQLTLAGQSSGASLIRALLGTPSAAHLFTNAWLHSDSLDYGFLTTRAFNILRSAWESELGASDAQAMDVSTLLTHQDSLLSAAPNLDPEFFPSSPLRPSPDGTFIKYTFTSPDSFPADLKPLVGTTVKDEAAPTIYSAFPDSDGPLPPEALPSVINVTLGPERTARVITSPFYTPSNQTDDVRPILEQMGTDYIWRCPTWKLVRDWAAHGAHQQFSGVITRGASYPSNGDVPECTVPGAVCHQDDIEVLFGTASSQPELTRELHARYASFVRTGDPNAEGYATWPAASADDAQALNLGGQGRYPVGACVPSFWGEEVPFDYQLLKE